MSVQKAIIIVSTMLILGLNIIGVKKQDNTPLMTQKDKLIKDIARLQLEEKDVQRAKEIERYLTRFILKRDELLKKAMIVYDSSKMILVYKDFIVLDFGKRESEEKKKNIKSLEEEIKKKSSENIKSANIFSISDKQSSLFQILMEVKKCQNLFQNACIIQQLYPLQLKIYYQ